MYMKNSIGKIPVKAYSLLDKHRPDWVEELLRYEEIEIVEPCIKIQQNGKEFLVPHDGYIIMDSTGSIYSCSRMDFLNSFKEKK